MPRSKSKQETPQGAGEDDVVMHEPPTSHQPSFDETDDASMADPDAEDGAGEEDEEDLEEEEPQRVKLVSCSYMLGKNGEKEMIADIPIAPRLHAYSCFIRVPERGPHSGERAEICHYEKVRLLQSIPIIYSGRLTNA